jgi:ribosomal protein S18 acetylase RimI-like enzyme
MRVEAASAETVRPLRRTVLRPHQRAEDLVYPGDDAPGTLHAIVREDEAVVGVATVSREPHPRDPQPGDWRVRGMATDPAARGTGIGAALLAACVEHARAEGGRRVWCNARTPARGFYERAGFAVEGEEFELPGIGPHHLMSLPLD